MNEDAPKMETPKGEDTDLRAILQEGGLDSDQTTVDKFRDLITHNSDREVQAQFQNLLIAYDEAKTNEERKVCAAQFAEAVKPYL